jgi:hypothetical protein
LQVVDIGLSLNQAGANICLLAAGSCVVGFDSGNSSG